jgi:hypothetical protein
MMLPSTGEATALAARVQSRGELPIFLVTIAALAVVLGGGAVSARASNTGLIPFRIGVAYCTYYNDGVDEVDPTIDATMIKCYQRARGRSNRAIITTQLGGRVNLTRHPYHFHLPLPASQYKSVSTFNMSGYRCLRYRNGVTCKIPGHVFFVTSTTVSGH